jgi:predicted DNA-binding transcriptional regulator AlpA
MEDLTARVEKLEQQVQFLLEKYKTRNTLNASGKILTSHLATPRKQSRKRQKAYQRVRPNIKLHYEGAALVSIPESTRVTGFGVSSSYKKARAGTLPGAVMLDGHWFVHMPKLRAWLDSLGQPAADAACESGGDKEVT